VQADRDVDVIRNCKGNTLDPSQEDDVMSAKMIVDATKPVHRPYEERVRVPRAALERIDLDEYLAPAKAPIAQG
jgi:2,5-furandicarboxylate decarboxylase 1